MQSINDFSAEREDGDTFTITIRKGAASFNRDEFRHLINRLIMLEQGIEGSTTLETDFHGMALEQYKNIRKLREAFENAKRLRDIGFSLEFKVDEHGKT